MDLWLTKSYIVLNFYPDIFPEAREQSERQAHFSSRVAGVSKFPLTGAGALCGGVSLTFPSA